jgi:threonine dehydratase
MTEVSNDLVISAADVRAASKRISGVAVRTPLLEFASLNERVGQRVLVKFEGLQHTGSFKFRGAFNRLAAIEPSQRWSGVVAWSSGNHAQGVAAAARRLGMTATIVMPADAPAVKLNNTRALGAEVVLYDRFSESREEIATRIATDRSATSVPPYDDPYIIAGQGTIGLEILEQANELGASVGTVLVCCGGGGLVAGISTAIRSKLPETDVYSVEPIGFDDTARSLTSGKRETNDSKARSICDALLAPSPGALTFPINRALLTGGLCVSDDEVREAMRYAFEKMKLVVEPGGAAALAAALLKKAPQREGDIVVVISGSNVDADLFANILATRGQ